MDLIIARVLHIVAGALWVGAGTTALFMISPYFRKLRAEGTFSQQYFFAASAWGWYMGILAIVNVVAGLYLYYRLSNGFQNNWMSQSGMISLTVGSAAGLLAFIHGGAMLSTAQGQLGKYLSTLQGVPTPDQQSEIRTLEQRAQIQSYMNVGLLLVALIGMAAARYL
jgi:uncharacterized membrane protein